MPPAPYQFAGMIAAYSLIPLPFLTILPFVLPYLMLVVGCCLVFGSHEAVARKVAASLFIAFFLVQLVAWLSGAQISCGCFGYSTTPISPMTIAIPAVLGVAIFVVIANDAKRRHKRRQLVEQGV